MATVSYEELEFEVFPDVYPPSEESFLLAKYAKNVKGRVLDLCCGCGFIGIINAKRNPGNSVLGVDISPSAVENSKLNAKKNGAGNYCCIKSDLFKGIRSGGLGGVGLRGQSPLGLTFDWIICNPPYLPTSRKEKLPKPLNFAFDGGKDGRKLIDRMIGEIGKNNHLTGNGNKGGWSLSGKGGLLLLDSSLDDTGKTIAMLEKIGFGVKILETEHIFFEDLNILEARGRQ